MGRRPQTTGKSADDGGDDESGDDEPVAAASEELRAEARQASKVLHDMFPDMRRGRAHSAAGPRGGTGANSSGGLVVGRFRPGGVSSKNLSVAPVRTADDEDHATQTAATKKRRVKGSTETQTMGVAVHPGFAAVFREERKERATEAVEEEVKAEVSWLSSLGVSAVAGAPAAAPKPVTLKTNAAEVSVKPVASKWAGKALPVEPFWRTRPLEELEAENSRDRGPLLDRMRRMAKDAKRAQLKRSAGRRPPARAAGAA